MKKILLVLMFLLMATGVRAQTAGTPSAVMRNNMSDGAWLGIPRWKAAHTHDTLYGFPAFNNGYPSWCYSLNGGTGFDSVKTAVDIAFGTDMHQSIWFAQGIHYTVGDGGTLYRFIRPPVTAATDRETYKQINTYGAGATYNNVVAKDSLEVWLFTRMDDLTKNVYCYHTTNRFTTIDSSVAFDVNVTGKDKIRMGGMMDSSGKAILIVLADWGTSADGFYYTKWNGSAFDAPDDSAIFTSASGFNLGSGTERAMAFNYMNGRIHFLVGVGNYLHHLYQNGTGVWQHDTATYNSLVNGVEFYPTTTVRDNQLWAIWNRGILSGDSVIVAKPWTEASHWAADSIVVSSTDHYAKYAMSVPNCDSLDYVPIWYDNMVGDSVYFNKITFEAASPNKAIGAVQLGDVDL